MRGAAIITTPQVPRYEPKERTAALQTPRAQGVGPDAFGGGLARGMNQASGGALAVLKQEKDRADATATLERRVNIDTKETELAWGTDENPGFLRREGKEVFGLPEKVLTDYDTYIAEQEKQIPNEEQRKAFRLFAQQRRNSLNTNLQRHIHAESERYAKQANEAALKSTLNNVALYYNDPQRIEQELRFGLGVIESNTENASIPREVVEQRRALLTSAVHKTVIGRIAEESPLKAKDYFEKHKDLLTGEDATKMEATLKPLAEAQQAQDAADEIFYGAGEGEPLDTLVKKARERFSDNPAVAKAAESQLRSLYTAKKEAEQQAVSDAENSVYAAIAQVKQQGGIPQKSDVPQTAWNRLAQVAPDRVLKIMDYLSAGKSSGESPDQLQNWANLVSDPQSLMAANLDEMYTKGALADSRYMDLVKRKKSLLEDPDKDVAIRTELQTVDQILKGASLKKGSEKYNQAMDYIEGRKKAFQLSNGRGPTRKELEEITREALYSSGGDDWIPFNEKPAYQMTIEDVPSGKRESIRNALSSRGYPTDDAWVISSYVSYLNNGGQ